MPNPRGSLTFLALGLTLCARAARAQGRLDSIVVHVADSRSQPVAGVEVTITNPTAGGVLSAFTDASGNAKLPAPTATDSVAYALVIRKMGFARTTRGYAAKDLAGVSALNVVLEQLSVSLDTVRTEADRLASKNYLLNGRDITQSSRPIYDAFDAVRKLRPNMLGDRGRLCPHVSNVWINGRRVFWNAALLTRRVYTDPAPGSRSVSPPRSRVSAGPDADSVLRTIKAEHIDEIRYVNCWDTSMPQLGTNDALFITLKPGIDWNWKLGSFAVESPTRPQ